MSDYDWVLNCNSNSVDSEMIKNCVNIKLDKSSILTQMIEQEDDCPTDGSEVTED